MGSAGYDCPHAVSCRTWTNTLHKAFFSNAEQGLACLLFYPGYGVEGWPDVVHGGIIMTLMKEAMEQAANLYQSSRPEQAWADLENIEVNFEKPLHPGSVYAVFVFVEAEPASLSDSLQNALGPGRRKARKVSAKLVEPQVLDWHGQETIPLKASTRVRIP